MKNFFLLQKRPQTVASEAHVITMEFVVISGPDWNALVQKIIPELDANTNWTRAAPEFAKTAPNARISPPDINAVARLDLREQIGKNRIFVLFNKFGIFTEFSRKI